MTAELFLNLENRVFYVGDPVYGTVSVNVAQKKAFKLLKVTLELLGIEHLEGGTNQHKIVHEDVVEIWDRNKSKHNNNPVTGVQFEREFHRLIPRDQSPSWKFKKNHMQYTLAGTLLFSDGKSVRKETHVQLHTRQDTLTGLADSSINKGEDVITRSVRLRNGSSMSGLLRIVPNGIVSLLYSSGDAINVEGNFRNDTTVKVADFRVELVKFRKIFLPSKSGKEERIQEEKVLVVLKEKVPRTYRHIFTFSLAIPEECQTIASPTYREDYYVRLRLTVQTSQVPRRTTSLEGLALPVYIVRTSVTPATSRPLASNNTRSSVDSAYSAQSERLPSRVDSVTDETHDLVTRMRGASNIFELEFVSGDSYGQTFEALPFAEEVAQVYDAQSPEIAELVDPTPTPAPAPAQTPAPAPAQTPVPPTNDEGLSELECTCCMDARRNVFLRPCGHCTMCAECAEQVDKCPHCSAPIESRDKIYFP